MDFRERCTRSSLQIGRLSVNPPEEASKLLQGDKGQAGHSALLSRAGAALA
jgi:hypothetical protein